MFTGEPEQVVGARSRERVDRLARVADDAHVVAIAEPQLQQVVLQRRDVLVLVDGVEAVLLVHLLGDPRLRLDHAGGREQHILEVELAALVFDVFVGLLQVDHLLHGEHGRQRPVARRVLLDRQARDLAPLDLGRSVAQSRRVDAKLDGVGGVREQARLAVEQPRHGSADHLRPEEVELRERCRVEGARRDTARAERTEPRAQLAGRAARERERHDLAWRVHTGRDAVGDPVGDRARLAGARTREHAHRARAATAAARRCWSSSGASRSSELVTTPARSSLAVVDRFRRTTPRRSRVRSRSAQAA